MGEVKENLRTISEKFLKWIIEGVQSQEEANVREMAFSVRQMRTFLIEKKQKAGKSKSLSQLKQLETLIPLLDSANYLTSVSKDYLNKFKENRDKEKSHEHEEDNEHDSSFADMFRDETQVTAGKKSEPQKDTVVEENTQNISQALKATPSKSILKTASNETPTIQKKLSFAKKATKVYEDNETSQVSLAKSSGSVKSVDDYNPKALSPSFASSETGSNPDVMFETQMSMQENSREPSEDIFNDAESIIDSSFQEDLFSLENPKNVKLFKAKKLMVFTQEKSKTDDRAKSATNQVNVLDELQEIEPDPLLSQESPNLKQNASGSMKDQQTDKTLPFHDFVLKLPHDSSGSEASLDARVNMAINLVNMKPREPELKQQARPDNVETSKHSSDGIVESSVTCTDFRWMEPREYHQLTSQGSSLEEIQRFEELPATIFEDSIAIKDLLPPQHENETKIPETHHIDKQRQETGVHGKENHPQSNSAFPPKPTWANPFQPSHTHFSSSHQAAKLDLIAPKPENSLKHKILNIVQSKNGENSMSIEQQQSSTAMKKEEMPKIIINEVKKDWSQPNMEQLNHSKTTKKSSQSQNIQSSKKIAGARLLVGSNILHGTEKSPDKADILQETYDSHKFAKANKYITRQSLKQVLKEAVQTAAKRHQADEPKKQDAEFTTSGELLEQPGPTSKITQDNSKIARLLRFKESWNNQSTTPMPDTEVNLSRTQSNTELLDENSIGRSKSVRGEDLANAKSTVVKRQPRTKSKPIQGEAQTVSSKKQQRKLEGKGEVSENRNSTKERRNKINTKQGKLGCLNKQTTLLETKWADSTNPITNFTSSTPLTDTILVETANLLDPARLGNDTGARNINTSSTICETSFSGEKASRGHRKQANSARKKNQSSQNQLKLATQQPQAHSKLSQGTEPVKKRGRGRPPKPGNAANPSKKYAISTTSESALTSTCSKPDYSLFNNIESNIQHQKPPEQLKPSKQHFRQAQPCLPSRKPDFQQVQSVSSKQGSKDESDFLKCEKLQVPQAMFLAPQPVNISKHSAVESDQIFLNNLHQKLNHQNLHASKRDSAQTELGFLKFQDSTESFKQLAINYSVNADISRPVHAQNEPWLINMQQDGEISQIVSASNKKERGGASFFEPRPENAPNQFSQLFNQPSNVVNCGQKIQTVQNDWQFNFPSTSGAEPPYKNRQSPKDHQMLPAPQIQAPKINWPLFGQINTAIESKNDDIGTEMEKTAKARASFMDFLTVAPAIEHQLEGNVQERVAGNQTKKRASQEGAWQCESPKIMKLQENQTKTNKDTNNVSGHSLGTQGTPVLYEECEHLSWTSDEFPNTQMFDTQMINTEMFDTQMINTHMFDSQHSLLRQDVESAAVSKSPQTAENEHNPDGDESPLKYEAHSQLSWGFTAVCENATPYFQAPEAQESHQYHKNLAGISGIKETNTRNNSIKDCETTPFCQYPKPDSGTVQNHSETDQPASFFTEFKTGVQISSTELTESRKSPPGFEEPAERKYEENHNYLGLSTHYAGAEKTGAFTKETSLHHEDPIRHSVTIQNLSDSNQTAYTKFKLGFQGGSTDLVATTKNSTCEEPAKKKTVAEEVDELINSIKWIRRIPDSELIPAASIEELINDQSFDW